MGCENKYMLENSQRTGLQALAVTRRNHTAEEEPDLGELSELLHRGETYSRKTQKLQQVVKKRGTQTLLKTIQDRGS